MGPQEADKAIRAWLDSERLDAREVKDPQAILHLHVRYPPTKQGHLFNVVIPKRRNLALVYSITRVDEGQQKSMRSLASENSDGWEEWLHDTRIHLTSSDLDWVLHVGHSSNGVAGPLQAFNLSRPIWFDGLTQNEIMHTMEGMADQTLPHTSDQIRFWQGVRQARARRRLGSKKLLEKETPIPT